MADSMTKAMANRSLRTIKTELEFLLDADVITQQQYDTITNQLPANASARSALPTPALTPSEAPAQQFGQMNLKDTGHEKVGYYGNNHNNNNNAANPAPPAYPTPPVAPLAPAALAYATAMYQYNAQDAGDLALMPNDKVTVTEYMNNEWWKGTNERTGQEGIFPASYVRREDKAIVPAAASPAQPPAPSNYGNMPLDVSNGAQNPNEPRQPGKGEEMGKKFGKKLGNAAIFGAGATIGGKIVNGIF